MIEGASYPAGVAVEGGLVPSESRWPAGVLLIRPGGLRNG